MEMLKAEPLPWRAEPSLQLVENYEREFGVALPADYRAFLASHGGVSLSAQYPFAEPTPFGPRGEVAALYGFVPAGTSPAHRSRDVHWATWLIDGFPDVVAIADSFWGGMIWLKCTGDDGASVYFHDGERRHTNWRDADFYKRFPNLAPEIKKYLELRRNNLLPKKGRGYENLYLIAHSFSEFISVLQPL